MAKHAPAEQMIKELQDLLSKANALEASAPDAHQKEAAVVLGALVRGQMHAIGELEHLKKAIDLLTLELFKASKS